MNPIHTSAEDFTKGIPLPKHIQYEAKLNNTYLPLLMTAPPLYSATIVSKIGTKVYIPSVNGVKGNDISQITLDWRKYFPSQVSTKKSLANGFKSST